MILKNVVDYKTFWLAEICYPWGSRCARLTTDFEPTLESLKPFSDDIFHKTEHIWMDIQVDGDKGNHFKDSKGLDVTGQEPEVAILRGECRVYRTTFGV